MQKSIEIDFGFKVLFKGRESSRKEVYDAIGSIHVVFCMALLIISCKNIDFLRQIHYILT